jgi:glutathione S-transferase
MHQDFCGGAMLRLCGFHISNYFNKVRIAMLEKGLDFELDPTCRPSQKDDFLARTPMGKVPFLEVDGEHLVESQVICDYLEDAYPERPLYPRDPLARARVRELIAIMELHMELVARRLYRQVFFGGTISDEVKAAVETDLAKGVRAFRMRAKFDPYVAGSELTLADCAAAVHLPLVSLASRLAYGRDFLDSMPQVKPYLQLVGERPAFRQVAEDRKASQAALKK